MAEFTRTQYNFNSRIILNDTATDPDAFVLVDPQALLDTIAENIEENLPTEPGIVDYGVKFSKGMAEIPVELYASTEAKMAQLIEDLKEAFNPDLLEADATYGSTTKYEGYHPLKWSETVGSNSRAFQIFLKAIETPVIEQDSFAGLIRSGKLKLKAKDPRKYLQTAVTGSGFATLNNLGTYNAPLIITITATGNTLSGLRVNNTTTNESIILASTLVNTDVVVIDTAIHSVKKNGTETRSLLNTSSKWLYLKPGNNVFTLNNENNATITYSFNPAWPL
jgi:hypothetical protein